MVKAETAPKPQKPPSKKKKKSKKAKPAGVGGPPGNAAATGGAPDEDGATAEARKKEDLEHIDRLVKELNLTTVCVCMCALHGMATTQVRMHACGAYAHTFVWVRTRAYRHALLDSCVHACM